MNLIYDRRTQTKHRYFFIPSCDKGQRFSIWDTYGPAQAFLESLPTNHLKTHDQLLLYRHQAMNLFCLVIVCLTFNIPSQIQKLTFYYNTDGVLSENVNIQTNSSCYDNMGSKRLTFQTLQLNALLSMVNKLPIIKRLQLNRIVSVTFCLFFAWRVIYKVCSLYLNNDSHQFLF